MNSNIIEKNYSGKKWKFRVFLTRFSIERLYSFTENNVPYSDGIEIENPLVFHLIWQNKIVRCVADVLSTEWLDSL